MKELLESMLSTDILSDEVRTELLEAFEAEIDKAKELAVTEAKVEFAKQFTEDKAALVEALETKTTAFLTEEIAELKEDIERFRDLETEYATNLIEAKEAMGLQVKADMAELVEAIDAFLDRRLTEEMEELKESIEDVRKVEFGRKIFESVETIFRDKFFSETGIKSQLDESAAVLASKTVKLEESEAKLSKLLREKEMARVLEPLHGLPREIMEAILKPFSTEKLSENYDKFIGRVLHESATVVDDKSEKENVSTSVLAESDSTEVKPVVDGVVVSGDTAVVEQIDSKPVTSYLSEHEKGRLQKMAGISGR